jgi:hypothetical protein
MQLIRSLGKAAAWLAFRAGKRTRQIDRFPAEPWFVDAVDVSRSGLKVQGWAFIDKRRPDGDYSARFSFNGAPLIVSYIRCSERTSAIAFQREWTQNIAGLFTAVDVATPYRNGVLEITCQDETATNIAKKMAPNHWAEAPFSQSR